MVSVNAILFLSLLCTKNTSQKKPIIFYTHPWEYCTRQPFIKATLKGGNIY